MDFSISDEQRMMLKVVRDFRKKELDPLEQEFLRNGELNIEQRKALYKKLQNAGLWALEVPESDGGVGLDLQTLGLMQAEMSKSAVVVGLEVGCPAGILYHCTPEQKEKYFYPIIRGEKIQCYAYTEPNAGSDLQSMQMRAIKDGNEWVLNGTKTFITHADEADFCITFAVTAPGKGAKGGITCFIVEKDTPGFSISRRIPTMGDGKDPYELVYEDCRVPEENIIGEVGLAFTYGDTHLTHGRIMLAAMCLGMAERSIELAVDWAKQRYAFGNRIAEYQAIQWMLADSRVELDAAKFLVYRAATSHDNHLKEVRAEAHMAKLYASEMCQRVTDRCIQVFGGMGYTLEHPIQSFWRHTRVKRIGHGTTEIHRWMIARDMIKDK